MQILIATSRFQDLAGSEITVLEYAIELSKQGNSVSIASFLQSERYKDECAQNGIQLSTFDDGALINKDWDIIWVFHQPTFYALFAKWNYSTKYTIFSSLSHFEPLESPPIEIFPLNIVTTNSEENLSFFKRHYPDYSNRAMVLPNSIPGDFWVNNNGSNSGKVLIVSNHIPTELLELKQILEEQGTEVDIYGAGYIAERITPSVLSDYKLCISIGKTVQYCLALKIPVFCYDHFGGPGWITAKNIMTAAENNFSGRCTLTKFSAIELLNKINDVNIPSFTELEKNYEFAKERFSLRKNITEVVGALAGAGNVNNLTQLANVTEKNIFSRIVDVFIRDSQRQLEYKIAWEAESAKRFSVEDELLKTSSELNDAKQTIFLKSYYYIKSLVKKLNIKN